ncbi:MAG TPA: 5-dehydro-4-deoxy-D-glucuronate isomerase [Ignavibacteriaceae bacterium]|nr:5-dehydro-4-deoxy-D-glucuronate isomerase [Ignavibacteriaceae bacterium]
MQVRYTPDISSYKKMSSDDLRKSFLIDNLFNPDKIETIYFDVDRAIVGAAIPVNKDLKLESSKKEMAADFFAERREIGIINIGGKGAVSADKKEHVLNYKDALYIGRGTREIIFKGIGKDNPAKFYFVSYPSHQDYPTTHTKFTDAEPAALGTLKDSNKRTIYKYIHKNGIKSSQLVMGLTELEVGSVWNTMPVHTHQRRSEVYMYFNLEKDSIVFHMMGQPGETRHLVIRNQQAVISPSWSIHCGAATQNYSFIWAMGGENQEFGDMDPVSMQDLK